MTYIDSVEIQPATTSENILHWTIAKFREELAFLVGSRLDTHVVVDVLL